MAGFQFVHVECYGREAGKGKAGGLNIRAVVGEAERQLSHCPHIASPEPPSQLFGAMPSEVASIAEARAGAAVDAKGRKLRKDALVMLAGVASFPHSMTECRSDPEKMAAYEAWRADAVEWLKLEYGQSLQSVIEHTDEAHPHIHWYAVPECDAVTRRLSVETIHAGRRAAADAKACGKAKGDQNAAYKDAMRGFQSRYYEAVGMRHGQARLGPARRRLTRAEWKAEQVQAESLVQVVGAAVGYRQRVEGQAREYFQKAQKRALEQAMAVGAMEIAKAKQKASKVVQQAVMDAARLTATARRVGGWIQAVLDGMSGRRRALEREAAQAVENVRDAASREISDARERLAEARADARQLKRANAALISSVAEVAAQRDVARTEVVRLSAVVSERRPDLAPKPRPFS